MSKILILNGPGLSATAPASVANAAKAAGVSVHWAQSNDIGALSAQLEKPDADAVIFNPAFDIATDPAFYPQAVGAIAACPVRLVELHLSNIYASDTGVPHVSRDGAKSTGTICGLGELGYALALTALASELER